MINYKIDIFQIKADYKKYNIPNYIAKSYVQCTLIIIRISLK